MQSTFEAMSKYGIKSVSMDDIARQLGISKKTIYQHFENKKDLVRNIVLFTIENDERQILAFSENSASAIDEIMNIAAHVVQFLRGMSDSMIYDLQKYYAKEWLLVEQHHDEFVFEIIRNNIDRGMHEGLYIEGLQSDVIARLYVSLCESLTDETQFPLKKYTKSDLFKTMMSYHIRSIVSEKGKKQLEKLEIL